MVADEGTRNASSPDGTIPAARPFRILAVDDSKSDIALLREAFRSVDGSIEIVAVYSGEQAVRLLHDEGLLPDLIVLDINMPGMSGFDVLVELKLHGMCRGVPVVIFSTSGADADMQRAYQLDAAGYMVKPSDFDEYTTVAARLTQLWKRSTDTYNDLQS